MRTLNPKPEQTSPAPDNVTRVPMAEKKPPGTLEGLGFRSLKGSGLKVEGFGLNGYVVVWGWRIWDFGV